MLLLGAALWVRPLPRPLQSATLPFMSTTQSTPPIPFDSLSPTEQRRTIARDAIGQILDSRLKAVTGSFMCLDGESKGVTTLRPLYQKTVAKQGFCSVCALGAILASQMTVNGDCPLSEIDIDERYVWLQLFPYLPDVTTEVSVAQRFSPFILRYFSPIQLVLIEIAFEMGEGSFDCRFQVMTAMEYGDSDDFDAWRTANGLTKKDLTLEQARRAIQFGKRYKDDDTKRLLAIMEAIVAHPEALFVPETHEHSH